MVSGPASLVVEDVAEQEQVYAVSVNALRYTFSTGKVFIPKFDLRLPYGSRCLLLGSNGSGKTTLLQILAGKYMVQKDMVRILGRPAFHDMQLTCDGDLSYLGTQWRRDVAFAGYDVPLQGDIGAGAMIYGVEGVDDERRNRLVKLLDIDLNWRLNQVSDGQRRRVQICMGLMKPYKVLLLDEITVDMDVVGRLDLLDFFKQECEERGCCIVYATHIFDGLDRWFTHLAHISDGSLKRFGDATSMPQLLQERDPAGGGKLLHTVEAWLREEREEHRREVASGVRMPEQTTRTTPQMPSKHMAFFR